MENLLFKLDSGGHTINPNSAGVGKVEQAMEELKNFSECKNLGLRAEVDRDGCIGIHLTSGTPTREVEDQIRDYLNFALTK